MRKYRYLTFADRKQISAWYQSNDRAADIAERLGMSVKTIYLELKRGEETDESGTVILDRNQRPAYNPVLAQQRLQENFKRRGRTTAESGAGASRWRNRQKRREHKPAKIKQEVLTVTEFERITQRPEMLAAFLASLPVIEAPWDEEFQRKYCAGCGKVSCDDGSPCPYEDKRNNPLWWLSQESGKAAEV